MATSWVYQVSILCFGPLRDPSTQGHLQIIGFAKILTVVAVFKRQQVAGLHQLNITVALVLCILLCMRHDL